MMIMKDDSDDYDCKDYAYDHGEGSILYLG